MALVYQRTTLLYCSIKNLKPVIKTKTTKIIEVIGNYLDIFKESKKDLDDYINICNFLWRAIKNEWPK